MHTQSALSGNAEDGEFYFMSSHRSLKAGGMHSRIQTPARGALDPDSAFCREVAQAFAQARADGIDAPVLMGAIPFDIDQPSELFIPRRHAFFDRNERLHAARRGDGCGQVVSARSIPDEQGFKAAVSRAIQQFGGGEIRKAVLSRVLEVDFDRPVSATGVFDAVCAQNPNGYQFQLPLSAGGHLVGVSPELLLQKDGARVRTFPLAGSAKRQSDPAADAESSARLLDSAKDHYEHSLVIDDIRAVLAPYCVQLDIPAAPTLLATRAMWHLGSPIDGVLADPALPILQLACRLHPTPAICGFPTQASRQLIREIEPFERGVFSGIVGWCDEQGNGEWAVTIRCATVADTRVRLFAGAGIVAASTPESEWAETQAKLGTMLGAFGLSGQEAAA
ncbi:isochorismate synthase [Chromobacterium phragmitis]|uniref:isochorismate synthase n=1 Tax=Chromobacterium phragmitis TaxID=2202141 RepID=A0A344UMH0_9NEIS|nr:isochorismate synthase [Chromobacterium phragmitis]AXE31083.1 isochorismate synthase [Chromobacterium phragmitis]AXE36468.1 isochorismate synthase [Chromobacterium phragmitis]